MQERPNVTDPDGFSYTFQFTTLSLRSTSLEVTLGQKSTLRTIPGHTLPTTGAVNVLLSATELWYTQTSPWVRAGVQLTDSEGLPITAAVMQTANMYVNNTLSNRLYENCTILKGGSYCDVSLIFDRDMFDQEDQELWVTASVGVYTSTAQSITLYSTSTVQADKASLSPSTVAANIGDQVFLELVVNITRTIGGFSAVCSATEDISIVSEGSFSLMSDPRLNRTVNANGLRSSSRGASNDLSLTTLLRVQVNAVSVNMTISCTVDIALESGERIPNLTTSTANIIAVERTAEAVTAHAERYTLLNTARLNGTRASVQLWTAVLYNNGDTDSNLTCTSSNTSVLKVERDCSEVYFDGSETDGGEVQVTVAATGDVNTVLNFTVWAPVGSLKLEADDGVLNRIDGCGQRYQETRIRAKVNFTNGSSSLPEVYVTSPLLGTLRFDDQYLELASSTESHVVRGVRAGGTNVNVSSPMNVVPAYVTVDDETTVQAMHLEVFLVSSLSINNVGVSQIGSTHVAEISLQQQDLNYIDSASDLIAVVVFSDNTRMIVDPNNVTIQPSDIVQYNSPAIQPVGENGTDTLDVTGFCGVSQPQSCVNVSTEIFTSVSLRAKLSTGSSNFIIPASDPAVVAGFPTVTRIKVYLYYSDGHEADVTSMVSNITLDDRLAYNITDGFILVSLGADTPTVGGATVNISYWDYQEVVNIEITTTKELLVSFHPFPVYEGSDQVMVDTLHQIGSVSQQEYQQALLRATIMLKNGESRVLEVSQLSITPSRHVNDEGVITVNVSGSVTFNVTIRDTDKSAQGSLTISSNSPMVESIRHVTITDRHVDCQLSLMGGVQVSSLYRDGNLLDPMYTHLVYFTSSNTDAVTVDNNTGLLSVHKNLDTDITITVSGNDKMNSTAYRPNRQPGVGEIDIGSAEGVPLSPVVSGSNFTISVFLNTGPTRVGVAEIRLSFSGSIEYISAEVGGGLTNGLLRDREEGKMIDLGCIVFSGAQGERVEIAKLNFNAGPSSGDATFNEGLVVYTAGTEFNPSKSNVNLSSTAASVIQPVMMSRRRRQADACNPRPVGDFNGDCVVDLVDTVTLMTYSLAQATNFNTELGNLVTSSENFSAIVEAINATDLDGDGVVSISEVVFNEKLANNQVYVLSEFSVSPTNGTCNSINISGCLLDASGNPAPPNMAVLFLYVTSSNPNFTRVFGNIKWSPDTETVFLHSNEDMVYGGLLEVTLKDMSCFETSGTVHNDVLLGDVTIGVNVLHGRLANATTREIEEESFEILEGSGVKDTEAAVVNLTKYRVGGDTTVRFIDGLAHLKKIECQPPEMIPSSSSSLSASLESTSLLSSTLPSIPLTPTPSVTSLSSSLVPPSSSVTSLSSSLPVPPSPSVTSSSSSVTSSSSSFSTSSPSTLSPTVVSSTMTLGSATSSLSTPNVGQPLSTLTASSSPPSTSSSTRPPTTTSDTTSPTSDDSNISMVVGATIGSVCIIIIVVVIVFFLVMCCCYKMVKKRDGYKPSQARLNSFVFAHANDYWYQAEEQIVSCV